MLSLGSSQKYQFDSNTIGEGLKRRVIPKVPCHGHLEDEIYLKHQLGELEVGEDEKHEVDV